MSRDILQKGEELPKPPRNGTNAVKKVRNNMNYGIGNSNAWDMPSLGILNWKSGDETIDNKHIEDMLDFLKRLCPEMNAAQMKSFVMSIAFEIDKRAKI